MRALRSMLAPLLFGLALLAVALVVRFGWLQRDDPGQPINSAMREAMGRAAMPPADLEHVMQRYPEAIETGSGLRYIVDQPGTGESPRRGQYVAVHYREYLLDGTVINDTHTRGEGPFNFLIGQRQVMPGWEEALADMRTGEKRTLIIPYWLGYGEKGSKGLVPARATLVVELELVGIR
jgi:FKBP-type peptidyl-prolyl cis-trans isomerase